MSTLTVNGIFIPEALEEALVKISSITPNTWNPNSMDSFMREKLVRSIRADGFILPIIVRPVTDPVKNAAGILWEIIDGEHRFHVAGDELKMGEVPILSLGDVSDAAAKQITIRANTLRGEFDSVKLAEMIHDISTAIGKQEMIDALPFTGERIDALLNLRSVNEGDLDALALTPGATNGEKDKADAGFKSFDPSTQTFECKCPRCGFEFDKPKAA